MCDHSVASEPPENESGHTRRSFLKRAALGTSTLLLPGMFRAAGGVSAAAAAAPPPGVNSLRETAYRAAMHLHAGFSEGTASLAAHISQAIAQGVDIVIPTDHDWRIQLRNYGGAFHFSGWSAPTPSGRWDLTRRTSTGALSALSGGSLVSSTAPTERSPGAGSLRLVAGSTNSSLARIAYELETKASNSDAKGTVLGRRLHVWVLPNSPCTARSYLAVQLGLANDPVYGAKSITYRLRTDLSVAPPPTVNGGAAVIDVPAVTGQWFELVPDLVGDIAACWPDRLPEDNNLNTMMLLAAGTKASTADGLFSYLHLDADSAYDPAAAYTSVLGHYRTAHPELLLPYGMEHSVDTHKNQLGGQQFFYAYPPAANGATHTRYGSAVAADLVAQIQSHGGVASYNHPFGTVATSPTGAKRAAALSAQMTDVLATRCHGADCIEIGYNSRGMDLAGHLELFDCLSANSVFLTATGVSDDHLGDDWMRQANRFVTVPWMSGLTEASLLTALRGGRASVGLLGSFAGSLDLSIDRRAYMGQVYAGVGTTVVLDAYGLPSNSTVALYRGPVDGGGTGFARPTLVGSFAASDFATGSVTVPTRASGPCFYRFQVVDPSGQVVAFTNPVWNIPSVPPATVPAQRLVL